MPTESTTSPDQVQAEKKWWASLTPEHKRMARDEEAVLDMMSKIEVVIPEPKREYTPKEIEEGKKLVFDFFVGSKIKQAIGILFAPDVEPGEFTAQTLDRKCVVCSETIWTGSKYRRYSGWVMHSECVEKGLKWGEELEKRQAFDKKWDELKAIRGEVPEGAPDSVEAEREETKVAQELAEHIFERAGRLPAGTVIPKPESKGEVTIKGLGKRRGEPAIIYLIPSHTREKPYQKGINKSELEAAAARLAETGSLTRAWFKEFLPAAARAGGCSFTTVGGLLELLGEAERGERGVYRRGP